MVVLVGYDDISTPLRNRYQASILREYRCADTRLVRVRRAGMDKGADTERRSLGNGFNNWRQSFRGPPRPSNHEDVGDRIRHIRATRAAGAVSPDVLATSTVEVSLLP